MKINWIKGIGYSAIMYVVAFMVVSGFIAYKIDTHSLLVILTTDLIVYGLGLYLATKLGANDYKEAAVYGLVWVGTLAVLDFLFTRPFVGADYIKNWSLWMGYVISFFLPMAALYLGQKPVKSQS